MYKIQQKQLVNQKSRIIMQQTIKQNQKLLYIKVVNDIVSCVGLSENNEATVRQISIDSKQQITTSFINFEAKDKKIEYAFIEGNDAFIIYNKPFTVYFITKQQANPIKLILAQQTSFKNCIMDLNYPTMLVFGKKADRKINEIFQFNFQTLNFKTLNDGKGYTPGVRNKELSLLMDGRIYVFGGEDDKGNRCEKMIWVYDLEKGFWFALQMQYSDHEDFNLCQIVPISTSKVLLINQFSKRNWIFQIHQSKITQLEQADLKGQKYIFLHGQLISYSAKEWKLQNKKVVYHKK